MTNLRIGHGYDVHRLVENRDLILGGVKIEHTLGLLGHSDADVLLHAVMDAVGNAVAISDGSVAFEPSPFCLRTPCGPSAKVRPRTERRSMGLVFMLCVPLTRSTFSSKVIS